MYLVEKHIFDYCNHRLGVVYPIAQLHTFDSMDLKRLSIYNKYKRSGNYYIFQDLSKSELDFIGGEVSYWTFDGFERESSEKSMARRIIKKVNEASDNQIQRDLKLSKILNFG